MIKKFKDFNEAISGTELVGPIGPNYGEESNDRPVKAGMTDIIYCEILGRPIVYDEYQDMYGEYLKLGGSPLNGFNKDNLCKVVNFLKIPN